MVLSECYRHTYPRPADSLLLDRLTRGKPRTVHMLNLETHGPGMGRTFRAKATTPVLFKDGQKQHVARLGDPVPPSSFRGRTLPWFSRERGNVLDPCWTLFLSLPCNKWPRSIRWQKEGKVMCTCGT